ncbi:ClpP family protease [Bogoriella caseilytica]|uniref:ATP-dependent Clp protease proteolytic subunit n=1 Tax=Bogoriella caseilytica TaxID=56055 RepID=A0A3N2BG10_9MICO|nr:ATP-dependent Clp protease proteolytic subunit [Bogoriella caseilytica]ROR74201.1 ATP-dependent Clp protease proteolytic subunit ClpP [Bogoriella caseilytica]
MTDDDASQLNPRLRDELAHRRVLLLDGPLDDANGAELLARLLLLSAEDPRTGITLWIHSPGGSVPAMLAIRDAMKMLPCDVATVALGLACSAGQFLLSAGTPGKRFALPHARILMHQGSAGIGGSAVEVEVQAGDLRHTRDTVLRLIAQDTGQEPERVFEDSLHDRWFTAEEARDYGFIDHLAPDLTQLVPSPRRRAAGLGVLS